jgi:hypothetical protein
MTTMMMMMMMMMMITTTVMVMMVVMTTIRTANDRVILAVQCVQLRTALIRCVLCAQVSLNMWGGGGGGAGGGADGDLVSPRSSVAQAAISHAVPSSSAAAAVGSHKRHRGRASAKSTSRGGGKRHRGNRGRGGSTADGGGNASSEGGQQGVEKPLGFLAPTLEISVVPPSGGGRGRGGRAACPAAPPVQRKEGAISGGVSPRSIV